MIVQILSNAAVLGVTVAALAMAFSISYAAGRFFAFTFGSCFVLGAYSCWLADRFLHYLPAALVGVAVGGIAGLSFEWAVYRPLRRRAATTLALMLASIGLFTIVQSLISLAAGDAVRTVRSGAVARSFGLFGAHMSEAQVQLFLVGVGIALATWAILKFTQLGLRLRAVLEDAELARVLGVEVDRTVLSGSTLSGAIAAAVAVVQIQDTDLVPTMGFEALLLAIVGSVVGGVGTLRGAWMGGFLVGIVHHLSAWWFTTRWQLVVIFALLVVVLHLRPGGIVRRRVRLAE